MKDIYYAVAHRSQAEIDSFKTRYQDFNASLIPQIFKKALKVEVKDWKKARSWGSSHVIFFVSIKNKNRKLILRANTGFNKEPEVMMKVEKLITNEVRKLGVPTNEVIYVDVSRKNYPFDFQIQEVLEGQDIEDHFKGTKKDYDKLSFQLGVYTAKFHSLHYEGFGRFNEEAALKGRIQGQKSTFFDYIIVYLEEDIAYLVNAHVIPVSIGKKIKKLFYNNKGIINISQSCLVHHDLADHNIMFKKDKITGIFDWEASVIGDPVLDLASCPTWKTHYPREQKLLEGYKSVATLPEFFEERRNIYRLRTMLWKMVYAIRSNILNDERKQRFFEALKPFKIKVEG